MKIRFGFVSNSSSTSFCIVGVVVPYEEYKRYRNNTIIKTNLDDHALSQDYDDMVIGWELTRIVRMTCNYQEFVEQLKKELELVGLPTTNISIHEGSWYDG